MIHEVKEDREYLVLPGGSVEFGESDEVACHQEVKGLTVAFSGTCRHWVTMAAARAISSHIQQEENLGWANQRNPVARRRINTY